MTSLASGQSCAEPLSVWIDQVLQPSGLIVLQDLLNRSLESLVGPDDPLVHNVVKQSMAAFTSNRGNPDLALAQVARLLWELGDRQARRKRSACELDVSFRKIRKAVRPGLRFVMRTGTTKEQFHIVQEALDRYLELLHRHILFGWERRRILSIEGSTVLSGQIRLPRPSDPDQLASLQAFYALEDCAPYRAVVAVDGSVSDRLSAVPLALTTDDPSEVLLPSDCSIKRIGELATDQCVIGPVIELSRAADSAVLAHRGAEALRDNAAYDDRRAVPYEVLADIIAIDHDSPLTDMLIKKHLGHLSGLNERRRLATGEFLLEWLLRGVPMAQLARDLNIAKQTAHYRIQAARDLFGDVLDDPQQRFELIIALRSSLPAWRKALIAAPLSGRGRRANASGTERDLRAHATASTSATSIV